MNKVFHGKVDKYQFFPKFGIYDEYNKQRVSEFNKHSATLYFIVKTPKVKFIINSFKIVDDYYVEGCFLIDNKKVHIKFNTSKILFDDPDVKNKFKDIHDFTTQCMSAWGGPELKGFNASQKYRYLSKINLENSNENYLKIYCALSCAESKGKYKELILTPYQLIDFFEMDCLSNLEIIYIGKSNDDTWRRIYNHNKWGLIEEYRENTDELLIYFMSLDKSDVEHEKFQGTDIILTEESKLSIKDATKVIEATMIIYFMKEKKFNIELVGSNISSFKTVREKLIPNNYTRIEVNVALDGLFGFLGTPSIKASNEHKIVYKI